MATTEKRPRGRPPTTGTSPHLRVRVPDSVQAQLRAAADARGEKLADLVRRALDRELARLAREARR